MDAERTGHMSYLHMVTRKDVLHLQLKESTYKGSWKKRGGVGAFMMLARKWDRIENMLSEAEAKFDIFAAVAKDHSGADGTVLAEIRDLRRYLMLVEAEFHARGWLNEQKEDSNKHAFQEDEKESDHAASGTVPTRVGMASTDNTRPGWYGGNRARPRD